VVPAIILAAGASSRMGRPKARLPLPGGHTVLSHLMSTLTQAGVSRIVVVTRAEHAAAVPGWAAPSARLPEVVVNATPARGQLSSLQTGLRAIGDETPAALVTPVDVPFVRPDTVVALLRAWHRTAAPVVRLSSAGRHGHPMLINRRVIDDVLQTPDVAPEGARPVIRRYVSAAVELAIEDEGAFLDVDTPEEYERLTRRFMP
jgi:CTP:molybdopterin cytidylyltransferase MocA